MATIATNARHYSHRGLGKLPPNLFFAPPQKKNLLHLKNCGWSCAWKMLHRSCAMYGYLPSSLLRSALWTSGCSSARRLRSSFAHTMNAFIGLRMWVAARRMLAVDRLEGVTRTSTISLPVGVEPQPIGIISASSGPATATHVQPTIELSAVWTTNCWRSSSVDHGVEQGNASPDVSVTGDSSSVVDPACIL